MAKRKVQVGDEFHKGQCVVRVISVTNPGKYPVEYEWVTLTDGSPGGGHTGVNSNSRTFKFLEGEGFTYHPKA